ncbi:hypothetical protein [Streptomyces sp. NPDC090112]|uniref:hypothetical protein n=1 Tax=Streptomyces sp. NPDC090112 TaxID=3365949 RepID=UPI0038288765
MHAAEGPVTVDLSGVAFADSALLHAEQSAALPDRYRFQPAAPPGKTARACWRTQLPTGPAPPREARLLACPP